MGQLQWCFNTHFGIYISSRQRLTTRGRGRHAIAALRRRAINAGAHVVVARRASRCTVGRTAAGSSRGSSGAGHELL
jgi:hypothetical protein